MATKKVKYVEPAEYIPKHIRKELGIGEFAETKKEAKTEPKKTTVKKADTKKK